MDYEDFKDKVISLIRENKNIVDEAMEVSPTIFVGRSEGRVIWDIVDGNLAEATTTIKTLDGDFKAIAMFSMMAIMDDEQGASDLMDEMAGMNQEDMIKFLRDRDLIKNSISVRFESKDENQVNSLATFELGEDNSLGEHVEASDDEVSIAQESSPFREGLF